MNNLFHEKKSTHYFTAFPIVTFAQASYRNFCLTLSNSQNILVSVFNNLGQIVCSKEERKAAGNSNFDLNLSDLNSGVCFVQVQIKESVFTKNLGIQ
ncbi:MAG: T9SS type A sorting domain-containing protein [Bacteroidetes bacterium]|nr:T9SS type A sorting domain-containing protein [Bacteroidota bacterium]PHX83093.1 MAG: hypothetical protein CK539_01510 [Flavobacteriales bacterium]